MKKLILLFLPIIFTSCELMKNVAVSETYEPTNSVEIIHMGQSLPANITRLGSITIDGQNSLVFSSEECSYEACMQELKSEAQKVGADIIYIVSIVAPNQHGILIPNGITFSYGVTGSECYTIVADVYKKVGTSSDN